MTDGGWKMKDGRWKMWMLERMEDEEWRMELRMKDGGRWRIWMEIWKLEDEDGK